MTIEISQQKKTIDNRDFTVNKNNWLSRFHSIGKYLIIEISQYIKTIVYRSFTVQNNNHWLFHSQLKFDYQDFTLNKIENRNCYQFHNSDVS